MSLIARAAAVALYATAFRVALDRRSMTPAAWRALTAMQNDENRVAILRLAGLPLRVRLDPAWATMLQPGATLMEDALVGPVALAP